MKKLLSGLEPSAKGQLSNQDLVIGGIKIVAVALIGYVLSIIPSLNLPANAVPVVAILVAILEAVEKYLKDNK